jgi:hypothetical protein
MFPFSKRFIIPGHPWIKPSAFFIALSTQAAVSASISSEYLPKRLHSISVFLSEGINKSDNPAYVKKN